MQKNIKKNTPQVHPSTNIRVDGPGKGFFKQRHSLDVHQSLPKQFVYLLKCLGKSWVKYQTSPLVESAELSVVRGRLFRHEGLMKKVGLGRFQVNPINHWLNYLGLRVYQQHLSTSWNFISFWILQVAVALARACGPRPSHFLLPFQMLKMGTILFTIPFRELTYVPSWQKETKKSCNICPHLSERWIFLRQFLQ